MSPSSRAYRNQEGFVVVPISTVPDIPVAHATFYICPVCVAIGADWFRCALGYGQGYGGLLGTASLFQATERLLQRIQELLDEEEAEKIEVERSAEARGAVP